MADFESFAGPEQGDKVDAASFEKFKERIKAASAQIKAAKVQEQKKRKKEQNLIAILIKFVKGNQKKDIMLLIARLLEENLPPLLILSIVMLGHEDLVKEVELEGEKTDNQALAFFEKEQVLPLEIKVEIDKWIKNVLTQALDNPKKLLKTVYDADENIKLPLIQLSSFILRDFLESKKQETDYEKLKEFSDFFLNGVLKQVKKQQETQKELKKGS
jgi:hypothetical protein